MDFGSCENYMMTVGFVTTKARPAGLRMADSSIADFGFRNADLKAATLLSIRNLKSEIRTLAAPALRLLRPGHGLYVD